MAAGDFYNNVWVKVERPVWKDGAWNRDLVFNGWLKDLTINPNNTPITANLGVGKSQKYYFNYTPSKDLGNDFQKASMTFHLVFDATQVENPGW